MIRSGPMKDLPIEDRLAALLECACEFKRPCRACGEMLYFVRHHDTRALAPYTKSGLNHFIDCEQAEHIRQKARGAVQ